MKKQNKAISGPITQNPAPDRESYYFFSALVKPVDSIPYRIKETHMKTRSAFIRCCTLALIATTLATGTLAKSCLWKVTSTTGSLYLQGSIHVLKADSYPLDPAIEKAYSASDVLVLEVDMKEMTSPKTQKRIMAKALLPDDRTLQMELDAEVYRKLLAACDSIGVPPVQIEKLKPWFASTILTLTKMQQLGFNPVYGLDKYFHDKAVADGKKVVGLESVDFQLDLFDSLSKKNPNDFIQHALADLETAEADIETLHKVWETGNIDEVGTLMTKGFSDYPELYESLVTDRNKRWVKTLNRLLKKPTTHMVVVGAGHLPGKGGLLELLGNKGYTVEQL